VLGCEEYGVVRLTRGDPRLAGALFAMVVLAAVLFAVGVNRSLGLPGNWRAGLPPSRDYTLSAFFDDANGLSVGAGVVEGGVPVGQVTGVTAAGRRALVVMRIDRRHAPVHRGTIARIRYATLLAQKYVELSPAAGTAALADGASIPSDQTVTPVDFDQFLSSLDPQTRRQAQVLVQQLGGGVEGRGATINLLLDQLSGLSEESRGGLATFDRHDADLGTITADLAVTSRRLALSREQLGDLVASTGSVAGTLAENDRALDELLVHLAHTSQDFDQTLNGNEQNLHEVVVTLDPFLTQLNGTLATTYPYLHGQTREFQEAADSLIPYIGSAIAQRDANGSYLRQYLVADTCYDLMSGTRADPATGQGCVLGLPAGGSTQAAASSPAAPGAVGGAPAPPSRPAARPAPCPLPSLSVTPAPAPNPLPSLLPCPTIPPCMPGAPTPRPSPTPGQCLGPGGVVTTLPSLPPVALPSPVTALLGMP
jgi:phospholipid/cholesterol/gamma-HCH transport system substrate-binding protein